MAGARFFLEGEVACLCAFIGISNRGFVIAPKFDLEASVNMKLQGLPVFVFLLVATTIHVPAADDVVTMDKIDTEAVLVLRSQVKALDQTLFDKKKQLPADMDNHMNDLYLLVGLRNNNPHRVYGSINCAYSGIKTSIQVGSLPPKMDHWSYYLVWIGDEIISANLKDTGVKVELYMKDAENIPLWQIFHW